ncbi:DUF6408 family protein [Streptomyces sp. NPDC001205]
MSSAEYKSACRERIREILIDIAVRVVSSLLVAALATMARLLF